MEKEGEEWNKDGIRSGEVGVMLVEGYRYGFSSDSLQYKSRVCFFFRVVRGRKWRREEGRNERKGKG